MKKFLLFAMLVCMKISGLMAQNVEDVLGVSQLKFNGTKYRLAWSAHNKTQYMQEYCPKGQLPESFIDMFTISVHDTQAMTPHMAVMAKEQELKDRKEKKKDVWNWAVFHNPDETEWIIDFVCCSSRNGELEIVEFDIHRYRMIEVNGHLALQLLMYSHRAYGEDITDFMKEGLAKLRKEAIEEMIKWDVKCKVQTNK